MENAVVIHEWQKVTVDDLNNLALYPREALDHIIADLGPGTSFSGFTVSKDTNTSLKVGPGRLITQAGPIYGNYDDGGVSLDVLEHLPQLTLRYVAVAVFGEQKDTDVQPRTFLSDAETRVAVGRDVATRNTRRANVALMHTTVEGPDPDRPQEIANTSIVAYVLLDTTGIVEIEMVNAKRAPSLRTHEARLNENDGWRGRTGTQIDTLKTDIAGVALRVQGTAPLALVLRMAADLARAKEALKLPSTYSAYGSDHYLVTDQSDTANADFLAKIEEGIRFPNAAERVAQFGLLNPLNPAVKVQNNFMLPAWEESTRLSVLSTDAELSISQNQFQNVTFVQKQKTHTRIRWGTPFFTCSNSMWWYDGINSDWMASSASGVRTDWRVIGANNFSGGMTPNVDLIYDPVKNILQRKSSGETFQILNVQSEGQPGVYVLRVVQFWLDEVVDEIYWDRVVTQEGVSGSIISQTFLNTQGGYLTSIDLSFSRVAAEGDVTVKVCQTSAGVPDFNKVIASAKVKAIDLKKAPDLTNVRVDPTYLKKGDRFGIIIQTPGNHWVYTSKNNKFAQGSLFRSTDGAFSLGDLDQDLSFQLNFAKFTATRVEVPLLAIELGGGIAACDFNYDSIRPDQCMVDFQVQIAGKWMRLGSYEVNPLNGLPPLLPLQVVLTGTTDEMPGIGLGPSSEARTSRPRSDFRHVSKAYTPGGTLATVHVDIRLEAWRGAPFHTHTCSLLTGTNYGTLKVANVVSEQVAPDDPGAIIRRYSFTGMNITSFKIRQEGLTDNVLSLYHVADRVFIALT